jgi:hypothetical protein
MQEIVECAGCGDLMHPEFLDRYGWCHDCRKISPSKTNGDSSKTKVLPNSTFSTTPSS